MMFCTNCGAEIEDGSTVCIRCGENIDLNKIDKPKRNWILALCCNMFFGCLGVHRFYTGYIGIGIAQLLTLGGLGFWSFIDGVALCFNLYKDYDDNELEGYNMPSGVIIFICKILVNFLQMLLLLFYIFVIIVAITAAAASTVPSPY